MLSGSYFLQGICQSDECRVREHPAYTPNNICPVKYSGVGYNLYLSLEWILTIISHVAQSPNGRTQWQDNGPQCRSKLLHWFYSILCLIWQQLDVGKLSTLVLVIQCHVYVGVYHIWRLTFTAPDSSWWKTNVKLITILDLAAAER